MKLSEIAAVLEEMSPLAHAEDYDNVGLLVGNPQAEIHGIMVCHDALESVIDEAIAKNCNMIVCFHPIIFSGLKKITGKNYVERSVIKAIKNDIAIYAIHTALDNDKNGVNKIMCDALGLNDTKILIPKQNSIGKLVTFTIPENADAVREALFAAGAGSIGNYDQCSFSTEGIGSFRPGIGSAPVIGKLNERTSATEQKIEVTYNKHQERQILKALFEAHIYEEVAYETSTLNNSNQNVGLGMTGMLGKPVSELEFLEMVKDKMQCGGIRHSAFLGKKISKVAVLGGSGASAISNAIAAQADIFLTADLKYHNFYEAENKIVLADIGHFESERYTKNYIVDFLRKKILNFAIILSEENTNPVKYL